MKEYFGIDVGGTAVKWAVLGEDFSIRERGSLPTDFATADEAVEALASLVEPYRDRVSAVGVSAPGGIYEDDADGTIHRGGALTYMDGCPLGKLLRERFDMPVSVNNDGKCCALGEYAAGASVDAALASCLPSVPVLVVVLSSTDTCFAAHMALRASLASCATT